jgi:GTP-binding protein
MNRILNRRNLVKVSARPGFTQCLNFFLVNRNIYFVDLPGYGFARAPRQVIGKWHRLVEGYFEKSRYLHGVVCIMDIRRRPDPMDLDLLDYLHSMGLTTWVVLNKADKISQPRRKARLREIRQALPASAGKFFVTSAKTGEGIPCLVDAIMPGALPVCPSR